MPISSRSAPIALFTDFGQESPYVGTMKAVILSINPAAQIFDLGHGVPPQSVEDGAFALAGAIPYLPPACICVAVVDPGVGTSRGAIALRADDRIFVGPDNGILSGAVDANTRDASPTDTKAAAAALPRSLECVRLLNPAFFRQPVSATFHGRDLFAPVAAHLSLGVPLTALGDRIDAIAVFPPWRARRGADGSIRGRVITIDHFGNLVTDVLGSDVATHRLRVELAGRRIEGLQRTYGESSGLLAYVGSSGFLEIALRDGNAAASLAAPIGEPVVAFRLDDDAERQS